MFKDMKSKMATAMSAMIQPIENVSYDLQTGSTGIKTGTGIVTFDGEGLSKNPLDFFGMDIPAFAMLTPVAQVRPGDILVSEKKAYGFIQEVTDSGSLRTLNVQGHSSRFLPTKVNMMGIEKGVTIVKSFGNLFGQGEGGQMDMSQLMMMSMMTGDKGNFEDMLPMLMLSGGLGGGAASAMNPLMLMMLMGDKNPFG